MTETRVLADTTSGGEPHESSHPKGAAHARRRSGPTGPFGFSGGYVLAIACGTVFLVGLLVRLWILGNAPMNSDEATAGLVAHQILHGHTYAFYWGQDYGGVETYLLALNFAVLGQSPFVLDVTPAILALVSAILVWRIGLRLLHPAAAVVAAVLSWVWCESTLWNSTRESGFREANLVFGLILLLEALRIAQQVRTRGSDRLVEWAILGAAAGLGFWASPEIVYFVVPAAVMVATSWRGRSVVDVGKRVAIVASAAFIGMFPWIWTTVTSGSTQIPPSTASYLSRLGTFFTHVLPMILGLRVEGFGLWEGGHTFGVIAYALLVLLVVGGAILLALRRRDAWILGLTLALYPFVYAAFPTSSFWNDGRYGVTLTPILALVIAGGLWQMLRPELAAWVGAAVLVLACASTLVAFNDGYGAIGHPSQLTSFTADPNPAVTTLAAELGHLGIAHAYAGYWVANDLTFISDGRVTALSVGVNRNPPGASNSGQRTVAWIFVPDASVGADSSQLGSITDTEPGTITEPAFISWLTSHGVPYRKKSTGGFDIIVPARDVSPAGVSG